MSDVIKSDDEILAAGGFSDAQIAALGVIVKRALLTADGGTSVVNVDPVPHGLVKENDTVFTSQQVTQAINNETVRAVAKETEIQTRVEQAAVDASQADAALKTELEAAVDEKLTELKGEVADIAAAGSSAHTYMGAFELGSDLSGDEKVAANSEEASLAHLNATIVQPKNGHVYVNKFNGMIFCWTEHNGNDATWVPKWIRLPSIVDLTNYYTKNEVYNKAEVDTVRALAQSGVDKANANETKHVELKAEVKTIRDAFAAAAELQEIDADSTNAFTLRTRINDVINMLKLANGIVSVNS